MTYSVLFKINRPSTAVNTRFTADYSDLPVFIRNHSFFIFCLLDYNYAYVLGKGEGEKRKRTTYFEGTEPSFLDRYEV